jgi:HK97 family phage portal protein
LRILPSQFVQVERVDTTDFFSDIKKYTFQIGRMVEFMKEDVIWTQKLDPSYYCEKGLSPLTPLTNATSTSNQVHTAESNMIENRGATGMISSDANEGYGMLPDQVEEIEKQFQNRSGGARNFNKTLISPGKVKYTQLGLSPKDLLLTELDINKMRKFCNVYGLSSQLLNDPANKTFNNLGEAKKSLYTEVCIPLVETFVNSWGKDLVPLFEAKDKKKYKICIETDSIEVLQGDKKLEAEKNNIMMQSIMSISKAVKMNEIDREQAVNILVFSHNLSLEEAESFVSIANPIPPTTPPTQQNNM